MTSRGDVVIIQFPFAVGMAGKIRPAVIVQADAYNRKLQNTIVAGVSSNTRLAKSEPTQLFVDPTTPEGASSGLLQPSAVKCESLFTVAVSEIHRTIGRLSDNLLEQLDDCLKTSLGLS